MAYALGSFFLYLVIAYVVMLPFLLKKLQKYQVKIGLPIVVIFTGFCAYASSIASDQDLVIFITWVLAILLFIYRTIKKQAPKVQ
jgi:FtsH-binding integral membrane protein